MKEDSTENSLCKVDLSIDNKKESSIECDSEYSGLQRKFSDDGPCVDRLGKM